MKKRTDFYDCIDRMQRQDRYIEYIEEENKKLKEELKQLEERYDRNAELYKRLLEENKKLKEERIFSLGEYDYMILTSTTPQLKIIKKNQNYSLMEEDTLQELRDLGEI